MWLAQEVMWLKTIDSIGSRDTWLHLFQLGVTLITQSPYQWPCRWPSYFCYNLYIFSIFLWNIKYSYFFCNSAAWLFEVIWTKFLRVYLQCIIDVRRYRVVKEPNINQKYYISSKGRERFRCGNTGQLISRETYTPNPPIMWLLVTWFRSNVVHQMRHIHL